MSFYSLHDFPSSEVQSLVDRTLAIRGGAAPADLGELALGLLFFNPSLRTQASFQRAAARLKLQLVQLQGGAVWSMETEPATVMDGEAAEHVQEAAAVLSRYVDVLGIRAFPSGKSWEQDQRDPILRAFMKYSDKPIINMESCLWHPCQALADWATLDQLQVPKREKFVLSWSWHPKALPHAVPNSTLCMAAQRGMDVVLLHPPEFALQDSILEEAERLASENGGSLQISHDRKQALAGAKVVYAKSWGSLDAWHDSQEEAKLRSPYRHWCLHLKDLSPKTRFFHCLPIRRNVVAADDILDSPQSAVIEQAENRLHAQTAVLEKLLTPEFCHA